jgi:ribosomal protein RSM22 (predicted rRNA methylase)
MPPLHIIKRNARLLTIVTRFHGKDRIAPKGNLRLFSDMVVHKKRPGEGKGSVPGNHNAFDLENYDAELDDDDDDDDDGDQEVYVEPGKMPWRALLENPARAKWRAASDHPPEHLFLALESILEDGGKTRKQMRITQQRIFEAHDSLALRRERERRRGVAGKKIRTDSLAYKAELQGDASSDTVCYTPDYTLASLHQRLLPNYAIVTRVMEETKSLLGPNRFQPKRVIDFGIGCGSASAAALDAFKSIEWIHGIDPSQSMRDCAKLIIEDVVKERNPSARLTLSESLTADSSSGGSFDLAICAFTATELPHVSSTLAAAAALWEKLKPNGIFIMIEPGTPDGFNSIRSVRTMLLDCCPPVGEFDDEMDGDDQCHIIAPCTHNGKCPMHRHKPIPRKRPGDQDDERETKPWANAQDYYDQEDDDEDSWVTVQNATDDELEQFNFEETEVFGSSFCSFVHTIPGGTKKKGEKISYLVAQKRILGDHEDPQLGKKHYSFGDVNIVELLKETYQAGRASSSRRKIQRRAVEEEQHLELLSSAKEFEKRLVKSKEDMDLGLELLRGDERRSSFGRIIRAPIKKKGHVVVDYCSANKGNVDGDGRIIRHKISKGFSKRVVPGQFQAARKARWGGFWPDISSATIDLGSDAENNEPK